MRRTKRVCKGVFVTPLTLSPAHRLGWCERDEIQLVCLETEMLDKKNHIYGINIPALLPRSYTLEFHESGEIQARGTQRGSRRQSGNGARVNAC